MSYERDKRDKRDKRISSIYISVDRHIWTYAYENGGVSRRYPIVVFKNRRFLICRDTVVTEKSVSTVMSIVIMIVILFIYIGLYI